MGSVLLSEGESLKENSFELILKTILSSDVCRVRVRYNTTIKHAKVTKEYGTQINGGMLVYLKSTPELHTAELEIVPILRVPKINDIVKPILSKYNISKVSTIIAKAIPIIHEQYTHRSTLWLLKIKGHTLQGIELIKCNTCLDTGRIAAYDECFRCDGLGCVQCSQTGLTKVKIRCQNEIHLTKHKKVRYNNNTHNKRGKHNETPRTKSRRRSI